MSLVVPERLSIELTNACAKACAFCYSGSTPRGETRWTVNAVLALVRDCARYGTRAVSFGGGEPLQFPGLERLFTELRGTLFRSMTTNGLLLDASLPMLQRAAPDKVHVSIHFPAREDEVSRVIRQVQTLTDAGITSGVNFLVRRSELELAARVAERLRTAGITNERIVYLPMRGRDTPAPRELARVAAGPFQSMTCLTACGPSPRFCAIAWDQSVAHCSYTVARRPLESLDAAALARALEGLGITFCGDEEPLLPSGRLARRA